ncbi:TauD/TfdA family dioxygenase [Myxococcota bacterium]|nr:TauD/TfdA family dioxygenase [Myxococcota bacterium]
MTIEIHPVTPTIGAEIRGVDLAKPLSPESVEQIRGALHAHLVLIFRDQTLSESDHIAFARHFGPIQAPPIKTKYHTNPEINVLDQVSPRGDGADNWHADHTYTKRPAMGSVLRAVKVPRYGGDTMFASMYAAYDALSDRMKQMLDGLKAVHDITLSATRGIRAGHVTQSLGEIQKRLPPVVHPVIRTHPVTKRKLVFVNSNSTTRIVGLPDAESEAILRFLYEHVKTPEFQVRLRWDERSLAFLDNRCAQHYAVPDYDERRVLHRVTIEGDEPY